MATLILYPDDLRREAYVSKGEAEIDVILYSSPLGTRVLRSPIIEEVPVLAEPKTDKVSKKAKKPKVSKKVK